MGGIGRSMDGFGIGCDGYGSPIDLGRIFVIDRSLRCSVSYGNKLNHVSVTFYIVANDPSSRSSIGNLVFM